MHPSALLVPFIFAASVCGITVTAPAALAQLSPSESTTVTWTSVSSDPTSFEMELIDPTQKVTHVLAATVQTSAGSLVVSGLPTGFNWTINFLSLPDTANNQQGGGILAQSGVFNVTTGATGATSSGLFPTTMSTVAAATATPAAGATATDATGTGVISGSATALNPTVTNGALGVFQVSGALTALAIAAHAFML
ncbi:hypothetical protein FRB96_001797 [Tulasnella sp. 330]|nr:hypothetical protein FRB96_001797 [Tulasnella sp. 330]KAG8880327.1 hypothetical protein FRB97_000940 [Tulasnella sp. 331]KAG8884899.1 hypothetical protein FRB98_002097 [Tulasnella sp. 332]